MKKYEDSAHGALEFIRKETVFIPMFGSLFTPDPAIEGVWKILGLTDKNAKEEFTIIIYMAGYKDSFGNIREHNDFEKIYNDEQCEEPGEYEEYSDIVFSTGFKKIVSNHHKK